MFDKLRQGAQKAGMQASNFVQQSSRGVASGAQGFAHTFSLPGESEKAANILASFLGICLLKAYVLSLTLVLMKLIPPSLSQRSTRSLKQSYIKPEVGDDSDWIYANHELLLVLSGLAIFQVIKAGFMFSGKAGSGIVIARLPDGSWSAPSCIATGGLGWGLQIGADITDFVIVLNSEDSVRAFSIGGNVTIGGNISAAAGPIGTGGSVQASLAHPAPMFSYSKSKGERIQSHAE